LTVLDSRHVRSSVGSIREYGKLNIERTWMKAHLMTGVKTNIVTSIEIKGKASSDFPHLPPLLEDRRTISDRGGFSGQRLHQHKESGGGRSGRGATVHPVQVEPQSR
jgi:hypothetical protein